MIKQRYRKTDDLKNNFHYCTDITTNKIRLMKIIPVSESEAQDIMLIMPKILGLKHANILKIYDYFQGYEEQLFSGSNKQKIKIQKIRCIYIIMEKACGFIEQYLKILNKQQISSIYINLKQVMFYLHQNQISGNIQRQNIFLDQNLNPVIYPEVKNIINVNKLRISLLLKSPQQLTLKVQIDKSNDRKQLNFFIYQILKGDPLKELLNSKQNNDQKIQEEDQKSKIKTKTQINPKITKQEQISDSIVITQIKKRDNQSIFNKLRSRNKKNKIKQVKSIIQKNKKKTKKDKQIEQVQQIKQIKQPRKAIKTKKIQKFNNKNNYGGWSELQIKKAYQFIIKQKKVIQKDKLRQNNFIQMSNYIKSRNDSQCRNFYLRTCEKAKGVAKVVQFSKKKLKTL